MRSNEIFKLRSLMQPSHWMFPLCIYIHISFSRCYDTKTNILIFFSSLLPPLWEVCKEFYPLRIHCIMYWYLLILRIDIYVQNEKLSIFMKKFLKKIMLVCLYIRYFPIYLIHFDFLDFSLLNLYHKSLSPIPDIEISKYLDFVLAIYRI